MIILDSEKFLSCSGWLKTAMLFMSFLGLFFQPEMAHGLHSGRQPEKRLPALRHDVAMAVTVSARAGEGLVPTMGVSLAGFEI